MVNIIVNPEAVLFLDSDIYNSGFSVAYNWKTDQLYGLKPDQFLFLKKVWSGDKIDERDKFVNDLLAKGILIKNEK